MGNGAWVKSSPLEKVKTLVSEQAGYTGDTKFFILGPTSPLITKQDESEFIQLFYEETHSLTSYLYGPVGIVSAIIAGIIVGLILAHL